MITKTVQPQVIEKATIDAEAAIAQLTEQLFEIRGETTILNRDLTVKREQISDYDEQISRYRGEWIPDTPARRSLILQNLRNWNVFSNSSPVEGITNAVRTFYDPGKKISIYVFGDEFTGASIQSVVQTVDKLNAEEAGGERRVRIHAVGFPVQFIRPPELQATGVRFATLMRELTLRNGGSFVGLNNFRP